MNLLAEILYPRIDPILVDLGFVKVRWYGVSYIVAFALAFLVLRGLARRKRWPIQPEKVLDVLFWGILGVFVGGRVGWFLFYGLQLGRKWYEILYVWDGGMSFHGGLLGVIVAYWIFAKKVHVGRGELFDGLALATAPGIGVVRLANFVNAELWGRPWDGPWSMRFPLYERFGGPEGWLHVHEQGLAKGLPEQTLYGPLRHPSQLYELLGEGVILFLVLRWLMLRRGWGGGRISAAFLVGYGVIRFGLEYFRQPDDGIGLGFLSLSRGQVLCGGMILAGLVVWALCKRPARTAAGDAEGGEGTPAA